MATTVVAEFWVFYWDCLGWYIKGSRELCLYYYSTGLDFLLPCIISKKKEWVYKGESAKGSEMKDRKSVV